VRMIVILVAQQTNEIVKIRMVIDEVVQVLHRIVISIVPSPEYLG